jgi:hypothetical protein
LEQGCEVVTDLVRRVEVIFKNRSLKPGKPETILVNDGSRGIKMGRRTPYISVKVSPAFGAGHHTRR